MPFSKRTWTCHPATSCVRGQHATTVPERHMWETESLNWAQFMLQSFISFPEFAEFSENYASFRKNSIVYSCCTSAPPYPVNWLDVVYSCCTSAPPYPVNWLDVVYSCCTSAPPYPVNWLDVGWNGSVPSESGDWGDLQGNGVIFWVVIDIGSTVRESSWRCLTSRSCREWGWIVGLSHCRLFSLTLGDNGTRRINWLCVCVCVCVLGRSECNRKKKRMHTRDRQTENDR